MTETKYEQAELKHAYKLDELYQAVKGRKLTLPNVQRGFVWKPYQIENLWDSLLRGYPTGAIVLSKPENKENNADEKDEDEKEEKQDAYEILDGQQRITSICLGMFNQEDTAILKSSRNKIRIFIDLGKPDKEDVRKYIFRVITHSHPWGYQRKKNNKTLESKLIKSWLDCFYPKNKKANYWESLEQVYPKDAICPIPFELFVNAKNLKDAKHMIEKYMKDKHLKQSKNGNYTIEEIFAAVKEMKANCRIPALYLNLPSGYDQVSGKTLNSQRTENTADDQGSPDEEQEKADDLDEIENMFVRLNTGGTPLSAEELNYSILKTHLGAKAREKIEKNCQLLFRPARFISLAYSLYKRQKTIRVKPTEFQKEMRNQVKREKFTRFLKGFSKLPKQIEGLVLYKTVKNEIGLPFIIASRLSMQAPEVMYMLMYRLYLKNDKIEVGTDLHRKMLGMITLFTWLGRGDQRDYRKLLQNIFPAMKKLDTEMFWSEQTVQRALVLDDDENDILTPFPKFEDLKREIKSLCKNDDRGNLKRRKSPNLKKISDFVEKIFWHKDLLLYAQRKYLSEKFDDKIFCLDDTNVPFDWDHILPHNYIRYNKGLSKSLVDWYHSNGNFWACPYDLNRKYHDAPPAEKMKSNKKNAFIGADPLDKRAKIFSKIENIKNKESLKKEWKKAYDFILKRNLSIIEEWYTKLGIEDFFPSEQDENFVAKGFDSRRFKKPKPEKYDYEYAWEATSGAITFYITYENLLEEDGIEFGFFGELPKIQEPNRFLFNDDKRFCNFTLTSASQESLRILFNEIYEALSEVSRLENLEDDFNNCLKKEYRHRNSK